MLLFWNTWDASRVLAWCRATGSRTRSLFHAQQQKGRRLGPDGGRVWKAVLEKCFRSGHVTGARVDDRGQPLPKHMTCFLFVSMVTNNDPP